jgi:outer membrane lipoprotein-sorting protein
MMLAITGDFDTNTLIAQLEKVFEGWERAEINFPVILAVDNNPKPSVNHISKDLPQTTMLIGHFGIKRTPDFPDFFALRVMNDILGEGGFTSRLMMEVREKHGLAYMVGSFMQTSLYSNPGEWFAYSQTRAEKTAEAISLIISIIRDIRETPVSDDELQRTKDSLINSFVFGFESSSQIAFQQMILDYRGFAPDFLETFTDNIAKVTAADVQAVAQKYLHPDALTIVTVGNQDNFDRPLSEFGEINEIEIKQPEPPPAEPMPEASDTDVAKAKEILAAAVEAHGGIERLKAVKNVVADSQTTRHTPMGQMDLKVVLYQVYPGKMRQNIVAPQGEMNIVFDGEAAFAITPMGTQPLPPEMVTSLKNAIFRDTVPLLVHLTENDVPIQYAGTEEVNGKPTSVLLVKQPSGEMVKVFISEDTHYVVKLAFSETEQGVTMDIETMFSDFRDVEGIKFAFHVVQNVNGELYTDNRFNSVKLNTELDESLLQVPE